MKTIRRDVVRRLAERGELVCVESYSFDDCYGADRGDYRTAPLPVKFVPDGGENAPEGTVTLRGRHFDSGCGRAWEETLACGARLIHLTVHGNRNYEFVRAAEAGLLVAVAAA